MATGSVIDSKIVVNGNQVRDVVIAGTKVFRVVANGYISYDRKEYLLTAASGYRYSAPVTGGTITFPSTAITSTFDGYNASGVRVNGEQIGYAIGPASLPSRAHNTASTQGDLTVVQDESQLSVTVPYFQQGDAYEEVPVPTGLTVYITNVATIPASGGSVNTATLSVTANGYIRYDWMSGDSTIGPNSSWTVDSSEYSVSWTGVTAQSKGERVDSDHQPTTAGTLYCQVTYSGVTGNAQTTVYQQANIVEGYTAWEYELYVNTNVTGQYPAAGGVITVEYSGKEKHKPIYTSTATGSTYEYANIGCDLTSTYGVIAAPSVTGVGTTTLTLGANTSGNRTVTITLAYEYDATKKATTSFVQTYSTSVFAYAYLSDWTGNGQLTTWNQVHNVSQNISNWARPIQDVYAVTEAGNTVYRTGAATIDNPVQADTYFYENDTLTFYTRNVTTAGTAGTTHLWYKNPAWSYNVPTDIDATTTSFTMSFSLNTKFYVTVKRGSTTVMSKTLYTGGTLSVNCGANTSTSSTRTFDVLIEDFYDVEYTEMYNLQVTQAKKVPNSISIDHNSWTYECGGLNSDVVIVSSVGTGWYADYDANYFSVSPASGNAGTGQNVVVTALQRGTSNKYIDFWSNDLVVGRARYTVTYEQC